MGGKEETSCLNDAVNSTNATRGSGSAAGIDRCSERSHKPCDDTQINKSSQAQPPSSLRSPHAQSPRIHISQDIMSSLRGSDYSDRRIEHIRLHTSRQGK